MLDSSHAPFAHRPTSVSWVMGQVLIALIPGLVLFFLVFGWGVLVHLGLAMACALGFEAAMLKLRGRLVSRFLGDGSAAVTAVLLALAIPPLAPWWITVVAVFFAIVFAKHLYGGLGYNPFNPAMVGYAILLISFPKEMTIWPAPAAMLPQSLDLSQTLALIFHGALPPGLTLDALSGATPLDAVKTQLGQFLTLNEIRAYQIFLTFSRLGWETANLGLLAGGIFLIWRGVITWHIPVSVLGSLLGLALVFHLLDSSQFPSPWFHLFGGASLLCAFFIATDPVTAATSRRGKLFFGVGIGVFIYVIRTWGGYPDGVAFAVLLMNMTAPMLDYYTKPRVFGH